MEKINLMVAVSSALCASWDLCPSGQSWSTDAGVRVAIRRQADGTWMAKVHGPQRLVWAEAQGMWAEMPPLEKTRFAVKDGETTVIAVPTARPNRVFMMGNGRKFRPLRRRRPVIAV